MKIAITGGIGSGKSAVMDILREFEVSTVTADGINQELLNDPNYLEKLEKEFPTAFEQGNLDKKLLSDIIFSSEEQRMHLNAIAHPVIISRLRNAMNEIEGDVYVEVPLLFECNLSDEFDEVWLVVCQREARLKRIMQRDNLSEQDASRKIETQERYFENITVPCITIHNDGGPLRLRGQVVALIS